jgi:hypothetical protein
MAVWHVLYRTHKFLALIIQNVIEHLRKKMNSLSENFTGIQSLFISIQFELHRIFHTHTNIAVTYLCPLFERMSK